MTILVDAKGKPIEKPKREDFDSDAEYARALHDYNDRLTKAGSEGFDKGFRDAMRGKKKRGEEPLPEKKPPMTTAQKEHLLKTWGRRP